MERISINRGYRRLMLTRFLRYVKVDTQSRDDVPESQSPSTPGQLVLAKKLAKELFELGLLDAHVDEHGYVYATLAENLPPDHPAKGRVPIIGLNAHLDTASETSGRDVKPCVHENYQGQDITYPDNPDLVLHYAHNPELARCLGHTIVTASGNTLLGADDKAGIAEIMTVLEYLVNHEVPHGELCICFSPDEEQGRGMAFIDLAKFPARYAYTLDGGQEGEVEDECFNAASAYVSVKGLTSHPGAAKGKMINAMRVGAWIINALPKSYLAETTSGREPYLHPDGCTSVPSTESFDLHLLVRGFSDEDLRHMKDFLTSICNDARGAFPGARIEVRFEDKYRNMRTVIDQYPEVVETLEAACRLQNVTIRRHPIRGGTDGATLSIKHGIPTPNLWAGGMNLHGPLEWVSVDWMVSAVETTLTMLGLWVERSSRK
jgi:tripeptide aminopeptidase